ncbi:MAG: glutamate--tRNA ligase [Capsulimonas sp.]|uniref:glutamate--tRNA ligase n=1 Tax=Capsulimonas sp. TaxID=2494211 RepID=UPI0032641E9B
MTTVRVRYAPSPTGIPHIGNIRTAMFDWLFARHTGGKFIVRIEDTDKNREVEGGVALQLDALRWYGLDWDEGPEVGGDYGPYIQSERLHFYHQYAEELIAAGKAYRAYDSEERLKSMREDQQRRGQPTGYDRRHRYLSADERAEYENSGAPSVVRFAVPTEGKTTYVDAVYGEIAFENKVLDDSILLKSDGYPTYHLASVVDDHLMDITHVLRGEDWIPSSPLHVQLYRAFGWDAPTFVHLPNMLGLDRKKFGKRNGAKDAMEYGEEGYLIEAMFNFMALQGWSPKEERDLFSREELVERFSLDGILNHSPITDPAKLDWFNGQYIRSLSLHDLADRCLPFLQKSGLVESDPSAEKLEYIGRVMALEQERIKTLAEAPILGGFFLQADDAYEFDEKAVTKWFSNPGVGDRLRAVKEDFAALKDFDAASIEAVIRDVITRFEVKGGEVIHPVRVSVSGRTTGPGLFEMIEVLGRERVQRRLDRALSLVTA